MKEEKAVNIKYKLSKKNVLKLYQTIIQILEDRTNTKITYTIKN